MMAKENINESQTKVTICRARNIIYALDRYFSLGVLLTS